MAEHDKSTGASQKRYPNELKERAVRLVGELRREDPSDNSVISRVARQLGVGTESLRTWVKRDEIESGTRPGIPRAESERVSALEREVRELKRANEILKASAAFFARELDPRLPR
jgi:transposase